jgi:hypothetical protein
LRYLTVKNYDLHQHYKSKQDLAAPAWIKLHRSLLSDYDFSQLGDLSKAHLMLIWLQASQTKGRIPNDPRWIADKIGAASKVDLECLIAAGFLLTLEQNEETALERIEAATKSALEPIAPNGSPLLSSSSLSDLKEDQESLLVEDLRDAWNEQCAPLGLSKVKIISATRRVRALARLREHPKADFWTATLGQVRTSPFLLGQKNGNGKGAHGNWKANFDWLVENDTNCVKVYEGR